MAETFFVDVDGIGRLQFRRRTYADALGIPREQARLSGGSEGPPVFVNACFVQATLNVLRVPNDGNQWPNNVDPYADDLFDGMFRVFAALKEKEVSFRSGGSGQPQGPGQGA